MKPRQASNTRLTQKRDSLVSLLPLPEKKSIEHPIDIHLDRKAIKNSRHSKNTTNIILSLLTCKDIIDEKIMDEKRAETRRNIIHGISGTCGVALIAYGILAATLDELPHDHFDVYITAGAIILAFIFLHRALKRCSPMPGIDALMSDDIMLVNATVVRARCKLLTYNETLSIPVRRHHLGYLSEDIEFFCHQIPREISLCNMRGSFFLDHSKNWEDRAKRLTLEYLGADVSKIAPQLLITGK